MGATQLRKHCFRNSPSISHSANVKAKAISEQEEEYFVRLFQRLPWAHLVAFIRLDDPLTRALL